MGKGGKGIEIDAKKYGRGGLHAKAASRREGIGAK